MKTLYFSLALILALALAGCGPSAEVSVELRRLTELPAQGLRVPVAPASRFAPTAAGIGVNSDVRIDALKVPIGHIALLDAKGEAQDVYTCPGSTNDACLVDLTRAQALDNLLTEQRKSVATGTYVAVRVNNCPGNTPGYSGLIRAQGSPDPSGAGTTYYTQSDSGALTTLAGNHGEARVYFSGCARVYPLPQPVEVLEGEPVSLKLYFDIRDIAFIGDASSPNGQGAWYSGGCSVEYPQSPTGIYVGANYLDVAGTVDPGTPTIQRFRLQDSAGALGTLGLMYTSSGDYFGGFTRSYFSADTSYASNRFVTPLTKFEANGDGTYTLSNSGDKQNGPSDFNTTAFVPHAATGVPFTDAQGQAGTYSITPL